MLKTILNFKGVEVLSIDEQKHTIGGDPYQTVCTIPWTPFPYTGPCVMLPQDSPGPAPL